ncbi:MAG: response regulator [Abditibacteriales bacterium]|nr:response regulator [Abditibacteriales bacterium]MDW8366753.1 response regulator [Abditibacteriales bacterium]
MALNVLVVDDSAIMRRMIIKTLRLSGLPLGEIYEAGNGQEGLQILHDHWIDLALVDINMPVMNGEEMINQVRANPETADLPIAVVSTESSEMRIEMLQQKGVEFVHKPFTPESLSQTIVKMTGVNHEPDGDSASPSGGYDF